MPLRHSQYSAFPYVRDVDEVSDRRRLARSSLCRIDQATSGCGHGSSERSQANGTSLDDVRPETVGERAHRRLTTAAARSEPHKRLEREARAPALRVRLEKGRRPLERDRRAPSKELRSRSRGQSRASLRVPGRLHTPFEIGQRCRRGPVSIWELTERRLPGDSEIRATVRQGGTVSISERTEGERRWNKTSKWQRSSSILNSSYNNLGTGGLLSFVAAAHARKGHCAKDESKNDISTRLDTRVRPSGRHG